MLEQAARRDCGISSPGDNQTCIGQGPEQPDPSQPEVWAGQRWSPEVLSKASYSLSLFYDSVTKNKKKQQNTQNHTHNTSPEF